MTQTHHLSKHWAIAEFHRKRFLRSFDDASLLQLKLHRACATRPPEQAEALLRFASVARGNPALLKALSSLVDAGGPSVGGNPAGAFLLPPV
jgi:hypothetical protein